MTFYSGKAIEKGLQTLGTTGPAAALGTAIGYGLPGSIKVLQGYEQAVAAISTTLISMTFNVMRNWWKHRHQ